MAGSCCEPSRLKTSKQIICQVTIDIWIIHDMYDGKAT